MADTKISALTAASALTGAEIVPVLQSSADRRTTAQDIADLAAASGDWTTITFEGTAATFCGQTVSYDDTTTTFTPADGDAYEIEATLKKGAGTDDVVLGVYDTTTGFGYYLSYQADGNIVLYSYDGTGSHALKASGGGSLTSEAGWYNLRMSIAFGTSKNFVSASAVALLPVHDGATSLVGHASRIFIGKSAISLASVLGRAQYRKLSP